MADIVAYKITMKAPVFAAGVQFLPGPGRSYRVSVATYDLTLPDGTPFKDKCATVQPIPAVS